MKNAGDRPFYPQEPNFTVAEAAKVSGVAEADIRNWMRRNAVQVGTKNRLGRIMFSALDVIKLRVIGDLGRLIGTEPSASRSIADFVANHCSEWMQKKNVHLHQTPDGKRRETRLILNLGEDGKTPSIGAVEWGESAFAVKVAERDEPGNQWTRRPFLIVPIEQVFQDVLNELFSILEEEENG